MRAGTDQPGEEKAQGILSMPKAAKKTQILHSGAQWQAKRQWAQTETQKVSSHHKKNLSCSEGDQRVAQILQGVGSVSILGDTQNPGGQGPQQSALAGCA